ncbi:MAG: Uncharacterized protein XE13_0380 [Proteiniphilum sp. 51_7]|nr:MAG: Uncharacterized protein XE13_0380 [Proteiniphilum sp. 51_7]
MKHIQLFFICLSLLIAGGVQAQLPAGRTTATIVADALAQLPAETPRKYNQTIADLVSTGEEGLLDLIGRMNPPGNKSNEALEYAISGWTHFVANDPDKRAVAANAFEKALRQPLDKEVKAFVIRQLRTIATDDNVDVLSGFLTDVYLSDPASQALVSIGTEKANAALLDGIKNTDSEPLLLILANAIGQTHYAAAEPELLNLLSRSTSERSQKVFLNALAHIGTKESLNALRDAAEKTNYAYSKNNATASYLTLLTRLNASDPKLVNKEAQKLLSVASKQQKQDLKIAASQMLLAQPATKKEALLKDALKDGNIVYLSGILNGYPFEKDKKSVSLIQKELSANQSPQVQTVLIYWLANHDVEGAAPLIARHIHAADEMVQKAAVRSLAKVGGDESLLALTSLLKSNNEETVTLAKEALSTFRGDISYPLASVFEDCGDAGKVAILELISGRKMESQYNLVYNQMFGDNAAVKAAAASTLKDVVTDSNLPDLFTLLEQSEPTYVAALQEAVNAALNYLPAEEQFRLVSERMKRSSNKHLYYPALANSGTQEAIDLITQAYASSEGVEKDAAFHALTTWKSFHVIYPLLDIARESTDNRELEKVTDALIATIGKSDETGAVKYLYLRETMRFAQNDKQKNEILKLLGNTGQYQAMLFLAPFMDQPSLKEAAAQAAMNIALSNPDFAGKETTRILHGVSETLSNPDADYQRQAITKYLTENPNEEGFVPLFNGRNLEGLKGLVGNPITRAKMSQRELAEAQAKADKEARESWIVENGELLFTGKGNNLCTEKQYGDFELLIDWKLYPGPEPDAGIYLRGTPQVQIWDTARVNVGAQVGSGGLYNNIQNPSKPLKVADQKVGEWNTFRIRMVGERVSVWLNGELVTDHVILENYWDRSRPIFPVEQIELQAHGSKVAYRDIYLKEIPRPEPFRLSPEEEKEGFRILFDGTNLDQWTGNKRDYVVESGQIVLYPSESFGGNLYTKEQFDNFVLRFEFKLTPGANNGLGIRTPMEGDAAYVGMELQIIDNDAPIYENLEEYQYHGSVYGVIPAKRGFLKPVGEWNYQEVIADGDHIKVILNGTTILDGNIREASKNGTMDKREHPGLLNKTGHIGFLGHGSKVMFRNIRIKEL